jgi:GNAT superfamily N-acetyltransferase
MIRSVAGPSLEIRAEAAGGPLWRELVGRYYEELAARFPAGAAAFELSNVDAPHADFAPPGGTFLVARRAGAPVGCGALRRLDGRVAEIRRMWVDPAARRSGVARAVLAALEDAAVELGYRTIRLDTADYLRESVPLYESSGYARIAAYNDNPYAAHWFEKRL